MLKIGLSGVRRSVSSRRFIQTAWLLFALFCLSLALPGIAPYRQILQQPCAGNGCLTGQISPGEAQLVLAAGNTLPEYTEIVLLINLFTTLLLFLTAAALIWQKPKHPAVVWGAFALVAAGSLNLAQASAHFNRDLLPGAQFLQFIQLAAVFPFFGLIPDGRFRPGWLIWGALGVGLGAALVSFKLVGQEANQTLEIVLSMAIGTFVAVSAITRYRLLVRTPQQEQVVWTLAAVALLAGAQWIGRPVRLLPLPAMPIDHFSSGIFNFFPVLGMLLVVGALTCLAVVLLSDELFRVDVALNRTIVYSLLTLFVIGGYILIVGYLALIFQSSGSLWFSLVATGVVAALFHPIRERLQRFVNRMIYGERDDPYSILAQLGQRLETAIASAEVVPTILQTVREALQVSYAAIALKEPGEEEYSLRAETGKPRPVVVEIPLNYQNETVGQLQLGPRLGGGEFSAADRRLLNDLARQAGAAIRAASQNADLQRARQRLVTAREEERRRVRRDLHDGLGASLAAINLQAGEIHRLIQRDPGEAEQQVEALREEIRAAIGDIRRLVYGLRPPALDELGLVEALRVRAAKTSSLSAHLGDEQPSNASQRLQVKVEAPPELPSLPAAVEAAAYRIAEEALTNTIQYARAKQCTIRLEPTRGGLSLEICDDGSGMPEGTHFGVGLVSMRERCTELGGRLEVNSAPGRGTQVRVWLPVSKEQEEESYGNG